MTGVFYHTQYLKFQCVGTSTSGKTEIWQIFNLKSGILLGTIKWYGRWRQYVFYPEPDTLFNNRCLADIMNQLSDLNYRHTGKLEGGQ